MEDQLKAIIDELAKQVSQLAVDKAVLTTNNQILNDKIEDLTKNNEKLQSEITTLNSAEIHNITTKE